MVNFISELQEQMCRFQKEINSKIREKKALESEAEGSHLPNEAGEDQTSHFGTSCDRTRGPMLRPEEGPEENRLKEGSSEAEQQDDCGRDSVGTACLHDLWWSEYGMVRPSLLCVIRSGGGRALTHHPAF